MVKAYTKKAFTLIELIFAIIIMGIVAMSIPVIMQVTSKSMEDNLIQEAVFAASAELMGVTTYAFDASSYADINESSAARVVDITSSCDPTTRLKAGHIAQPFHRRCTNEITTDQNSSGSGDEENIYNMLKTKEELFYNPTPNASGYKQSYKATIAISNKDLDSNTTNSEMRKIDATIYDKDGSQELVKLSTFVANIGDAEFYHKVMP